MDEVNLNLDSRHSLFKAFYFLGDFISIYWYLSLLYLIFNIFSPNLYRSEITAEPLIYG